MLHLWKLLEEIRLHGPVLDVIYMPEKHWRDLVPIAGRVIDENVPIRIRPVEVEVLDKGFGKDPGRGVFLVFEHETITKGRPGLSDEYSLSKGEDVDSWQ